MTAAGRHGIRIVRTVVDGQVHHHCAVCARGGRQNHFHRVCMFKQHPIPLIRQFIFANGPLINRRIVIYGNPNRIDDRTIGQRGENDIVKTEIVAVGRCILVKDGQSGLRVVPAIPILIERLPSVQHIGRMENRAKLSSIDAELQ